MALPLEWTVHAAGAVVAAALVTVAVLALAQTWRRTRFRSLLRDHENRFSPARLTMLVPTLAVAAFILRGALATKQMPEINPELFALYLASQAPIVAAKAQARTGGT